MTDEMLLRDWIIINNLKNEASHGTYRDSSSSCACAGDNDSQPWDQSDTQLLVLQDRH